MGKSSKPIQNTQNTTQTNEPPAWAKGIFEHAAQDAMTFYNQGSGKSVYDGQRVAGLSDQTKNAINGLSNNTHNYDNNYLNGLATGQNSTSQNLKNMASGQQIGNNPYFDEALQNTLNKATNSINSSLAGAGRYGSGAHTGVLANELGGIATQALSQQYNQDVNNMMNANGLIDQANQNQLAGANNFFQGQGQANLNALTGGSVLDANHQRQLDEERQKWEQQNNLDWDQLSKLLAAGGAVAGNYGTRTGQMTTLTPQPKPNPWEIVGNVGTILGTFAGLSDFRAKENIVQVGQRDGYKLYEYNYKGYPERYRGVMAQDVLKLKPEAVFLHKATGFLHVDYSKLGFEIERVQ
ncbi:MULTISPECIES: tail fiber domain-containing protein [unclassified Bartonella]|uniref:tail fiber domain-containing protein n=1 Tax=unclassified Bartonella TaxID=2645622 RepID=UPI00235EB9BC|nr:MULTISPECIES: tail fiber domain-containing protein [unclassified Bartonella]